MNASGWIQLALFVAALVAVTKPLGVYLLRVLDPEVAGARPFLERPMGRLERLLYRALRVDPARDQSWAAYAGAMLLFSVVSMGMTYGVLRLQDRLPLNPQGLGPVAPALAFNTAASF